MITRSGPLITLVLCAAFGCSLFEKDPKPIFKKKESFSFSVDKLEQLNLRAINEVFPAGEIVTVEPFKLIYKSDVGLLKGVFASGDTGSITVCVYRGEQEASNALDNRLQGPLNSYQLGGNIKGIASKWWYEEGQTTTLLFIYGNTLVCVRLVNLPSEQLKTDGIGAVNEVVSRLKNT